jgi:glycosyltransferase involved in cell wall biosynthesis
LKASCVAHGEPIVKHRILQIIPSLDRAGAEKQMSFLTRGLPREEFDVHVAVLTRGGPLLEELRRAGIPVTLIGKSWRLDPRAFWRLKELVARLNPDLVHTWLFAANAYGRAAGIACGVKCLVAGERCVDPWKGGLEFSIDRLLARRTARIVTNSLGVQEFYVRHGLPAEKFVVIPNAVAPAQASPLTRQQLLAELQLPQDARLVGLIGRLWPQKRVKDAIWAADLLKVVRRDVHLLVLGDGPQRERLWKFRQQCEISDKVHFLGHRDDVPRLLPHFDVLWSASAYEGQSNALLEAMATGVPVVATDIPGTRDLVVHGQTGYLIDPGSRAPNAATVNKAVAAGLARYTNELLDAPDLARRLGAAARLRAESEFSREKMIERHASLYRELLN